MADPEIFTCLKGVWKLVATDVTAGRVHRTNTTPIKYIQTYRPTGAAAPTDKEDGAPIFEDSTVEPIGNATAIDVYVMAITDDGEVRVDL